MGLDELTATLWRRRAAFLFAFVACVAAVVAVTLSLPPTYESSATLYVGVQGSSEEPAAVLDTSQGEQLTRTFTALASNPATADAALERVGGRLNRTELLEKLAFAPIERTQLLQITARDGNAQRAAEIANEYAETFVDITDRKYRDGLVPTRVTFSERAVVPTDPASPNVPLYIGFGIVLSALLAACVALLRDRTDKRLTLAPDADSLFDHPILARIPPSPAARHAAHGPVDDPLFADALRVLRTSIELAPGGAARTVMVTGSGPAEGKSTIAAQLALATAGDGDHVTLIECDLRRPTLDFSELGPGAGAGGEFGLTSYLEGRLTAEDVMREESPGFTVVYGGEPEPNPARLLRSPRLADLLVRARERSDWVIIDAPPASVGDDALLLTRLVDGAIFVADPQISEVPSVRAALARLDKVGARILGIVLNRTSASDQSDYYAIGRARQGTRA